MILDTIHKTNDLRALTSKELRALCREIRAVLLDTVSKTGGHLGANLGVTELTVALHRVFDSPHDIILWDTGHQTYVHKLLTGRRDRFDLLRQWEGLSGFPSRKESAHDWIENSHASTVLSYAHGMAVAASGTNRRVVAVIGDGALTGGMAYEGLNNIGYYQVPVVLVFNDNGRSYAPTISRLTTTTSGPRPRSAARPDRFDNRRNSDFDNDRHLAPRAFFESLGFNYHGPVDGHDILAVETILNLARDCREPFVVHVVTRKGKGYPPAENEAQKCLHDTSPFDLATGPPTLAPSPSAHLQPVEPPKTFSDVFGSAILELAERDPRIHVLTAAMADTLGLIPFAERYPDRFHDVGIAEQHAVTCAAGMAMGGLRPVFAVVSTFLNRAVDQLHLDIGLHGLPVVLALDRAGVTGSDGPSHHGALNLAILTKIPGMAVFAPSSADELKVMLEHATGPATYPCAIIYPKGNARRAKQTGVGLSGRKVREGRDVCIIAAGVMLRRAEEAADMIEQEEGWSTTIWDPRALCPLDPAMIRDAFAHRLIATVEDGIAVGGFGSLVLDHVCKLSAGRLPAVLTLGHPIGYLPQGDRERILANLQLDAQGIAKACIAAVQCIRDARIEA